MIGFDLHATNTVSLAADAARGKIKKERNSLDSCLKRRYLKFLAVLNLFDS